VDQPVWHFVGLVEGHVQEDERRHRWGEGVGGIPKASRLKAASHLFRVEGVDDVAGVGVEHLQLLDGRLTAAEVDSLQLVYQVRPAVGPGERNRGVGHLGDDRGEVLGTIDRLSGCGSRAVFDCTVGRAFGGFVGAGSVVL
jgi:hypothetical protein